MKIGIPRIIGILLIVIAALVYFRGATGWIGLGIAGLILIIASAAYTRKMLDMFIQTFVEWKTLILVVLIDWLYWSLVFGAAQLLRWRIELKSALAQAGNLVSKEAIMNPEIVGQSAAALQGFVFTIFIGAILLFIFTFTAYVVLRGIGWTIIAKQKADKKFFKQWALLNGAWWLIWTPIFLFVIVAVRGGPYAQGALLVAFAIASYFTILMQSVYMQSHKKGHSIANGLGFGLSKLHLLIVPYTYSFILYVILFQIFRPVFGLLTNPGIQQMAIWAFVILILAWLRIYIYHAIKQFK